MRLNRLQRGFDTAAHTETDTPRDSTGPGAESDIYDCLLTARVKANRTLVRF